MVIEKIKRQFRVQSNLNSAPRVTQEMVGRLVDSFQISSPTKQTKLISELLYWLSNPWINAKSPDSHKVRKLIIQELFQTIMPRVSLEQQQVVLTGLEHFVYRKETMLARRGELSDEVHTELIHQVEKTILALKREEDWQVNVESERIKRRVQMEKLGWTSAVVPADMSLEDKAMKKFRNELMLFFVGVLGYYSTYPCPETKAAAKKVLSRFKLELLA